jgi:hypothetical protein
MLIVNHINRVYREPLVKTTVCTSSFWQNQRQSAAPRSGFSVGLGSCVAGWSLRFLEIASGLGGERPSCSTKVVDVKHCRLVEVVGKCDDGG